MADRDFKGVWIPKEIWLDERLTMLDKGILTEIDSLDNGEDHCYAGNEYFARFCQCSESKVSKTISKLIELGYVKIVSFDGRIRKLQSCLAFCTRQDSKKYDADKQKVRVNNTSNNTKNKSISRASADKDFSPAFDDFWKLYPRKVAKQNAFKAWRKIGAEDSQALIDSIMANVRQRINGEWKGKDVQYIPYPATYLNQRRWEDEPTAAATDDDEYRPTIQEMLNRKFEENGYNCYAPGYDD